MPAHYHSSMRLGFGTYQALVTCPTGASHLEKGQPCQDACMVAQHYYRGVPYMVLAIADGHGSEKYSRSDIGAHFAVQAAGDVATELVIGLTSLRDNHPQDWHKGVQHEVEHRLGRSLVQRWRTRVNEHAENHPEQGVPQEADAWVGRYGSTAALTILYDEYLIVANLGDSSIYLANIQDGDLSVRQIIEQKREGIGLGTDSLVSPRANYLWRVEVISMSHNAPAMVLLTTDGLTDSLEDPQASIFDLYNSTMRHGMEWLESKLPQQLARWSADGVGDDMGCIVLFTEPPASSPSFIDNGKSSNSETAGEVAKKPVTASPESDSFKNTQLKKGEDHGKDH